MRIWGAAHSDRGLVRAENQDAYGVFADIGLFVVADGVGGQAFGREASALTVEAIRASIANSADDDLTPVTDGTGRVSLAGRHLVIALHEANRRVIAAGEANGGERMGSTVASVLVDRETGLLAIAHVGDARAYRVRGTTVEQLTDDHTLVQRLVGEGRLTAEEAAESPHRHLITQAIGSDVTVSPSMRLEPIDPGDRIVLCSDGIHDVVKAEEIAAIIAKAPDAIEDACHELVALANARGGRDNSTVVIVACDDAVATTTS